MDSNMAVLPTVHGLHHLDTARDKIGGVSLSDGQAEDPMQIPADRKGVLGAPAV